ncbi:MAG: hypothetical protein EBT52_03880 [Flavobacteriia bacterium]|nr:hypothetical protein [Flavobacteriia bacterium]
MQQPVGLMVHPYAVFGQCIVTCQAQKGQGMVVPIEVFGEDPFELDAVFNFDERIPLNVSFVVVVEQAAGCTAVGEHQCGGKEYGQMAPSLFGPIAQLCYPFIHGEKIMRTNTS